MARPPHRPLVALLLLALPLPAPAARRQDEGTEGPRNLVFFIADGFGPASRTLARTAAGRPLNLDRIQVGTIGTTASSALVTDSAASATAYACGVKTYNGAIGLGPEGQRLRTLLEAAEESGRVTGLVSTARLTHATPASFSAHVASRAMEQQIAEQQLEQGIELLLGGGLGSFVPYDAGGTRRDGRDLTVEARELGYRVVRDRTGFEVTRELPLLGLLADSHMAYELDRDPEQEPSLAEMTSRAIQLLAEAGGEEGFFLMIEAGRIDHAGHANDVAAHLHDCLAYDEAVGVALQYASLSGNTLVVATADHETGGMSLGRNADGQGVYAWRPEFVQAVTASIEAMLGRVEAGEDALEVLLSSAPLDSLDEAEQADLDQALAADERWRSQSLSQSFSRILSARALVGWTTWGHTAVDVGLFAAGPGSESLRGHHENDALGRALAALIGVRIGVAAD